MKRPYGLLLALLMLSGPALTGCRTDDTGTVLVTPTATVTPLTAPGNVAVLVVDDFGLGRDAQAGLGRKDDNCTVGANDVGSNGAGDDLPPSTFAHGELVYRVLKDQLTVDLGLPPSANTTTPRPPGPPIDATTDWQYPIRGSTYTVKLVAVHTTKYRTDDILNGVRTQITTLRAAGFDRFVLNLSFVVIPCDVVSWLETPDLDALLATYNAMISNDPTGALKSGLAAFLTGGRLDIGLVRPAGVFTAALLRDDTLAPLRPYLVSAFYKKIDLANFNRDQAPLSTVYADPSWRGFSQDLIQPGTGGSPLKVIPVGAAGNGVKYVDPKISDRERANDPANLIRRGLPFPFAPALWDFVVSATADANKAVTDRLNSGEVKLTGTGPALLPGSFGTSFSAPRLSSLEAKYLAETGTVVCGGSPPLGYVDLASTPVINIATSSPWRNRGRPDWPAICGTFPS